MEDLPEARRRDIEVLLATDIFQDLTPAALGGLLPAVKRDCLNRGAYFYRAGETSTHLWVLISGQAKGVVPSPDGEETVLDVIRPGQLFGLPGLLATPERIGSPVATEPCVALSIEGAALSAFLERHPAATRRTLARLADLVLEYAEAMMLAAHEDLRGRVARRLLDLAALHGDASGEGVRIGAHVPQEILGAMVGASRARSTGRWRTLPRTGTCGSTPARSRCWIRSGFAMTTRTGSSTPGPGRYRAAPEARLGECALGNRRRGRRRVTMAQVGTNGGDQMSTAPHSSDPMDALELSLNGALVRPGSDTYETHRHVWNGMIDKHPALISRCSAVADVVATVNFAREERMPLAVRGGGHSFAGFSSCDEGLVLDLSPMASVEVDPQRRTARAAAGVTWGIFDAATHTHGLASTGGLVSTTGIAGLTLGGGIGWLQRKCGLACDNLLSVQLVTAAGDVIRASAEENAELFWGLRGGGGNFGVVTEFEFRLHPVSSVVAGLLLFPLDRYVDVMRFYRGYVRDCPDDLTTWLSAITGPAADFVPAELHGKPALAVLACHCGDPDDAERRIRPLRELGPAADLIEAMPYPAPQSMFDEDVPYGIRCYQRAGYAAELTDQLVEAIVEHTAAMPSAACTFDFHHMGGAVARVPDDATGFGDRGSAFCFNIVGVWDDSSADDTNRQWARTFASALEPFATGVST